jgi:GNAT superfamily N-acetyltransferase
MLTIKRINKEEEFGSISRDEFIDFLFKHLDDFGDPKEDINKCLNYAFSDYEAEGGYALAAFYENQLIGTVIMNKTGMGGYIPDWILVYIAVDASFRGKGFGKQIIEEVYKQCDGDIKLHVEYHNPAKRLYERMGFETKYAEMRYIKK